MKSMVIYAVAIIIALISLTVTGLRTLDRLVTKAADQARIERDAFWTAEIEKSNAETEKRLRLQAMAAQAADAVARDQIEAANMKISELEKANEALPLNRCGGLGRDRVQLLDFGPR